MLPGVASATAVANTPVYQAAYLPLTPSATATGLVPAWRVTFIPGVATVTAVAFVVVFDVGVAGGHTIYAITGRTTRTSIANITLSGTASTTTQDAQSIGGGQASTGRTDADGTIDP
jgi:hypothetical protein